MCPVGVSPSGVFLFEGFFPDSDGVVVFGWDSVVVEGWSAGFLVGFVVVFFDKIVDFGELVLSEIALPDDSEGIVRQLRFRVEVPLEHFALALSCPAVVGVGDAFELRVDAAFQTVGSCSPPAWFERVWWWLQVGKQPTFAREVQQRVVGLAYPQVGPFPLPIEGSALPRRRCFLVEEIGVDDPEVMQVQRPFAGLFQGGDLGQLQRERVDCLACGGAWFGGGVAADNALGVDQTALDLRIGPARFDGGVRALSAVKDNTQGFCDLVQ